MCICLCSALFPIESEKDIATPLSIPETGTSEALLYSRISDAGMIVADAESWYLEENDLRGRPVRATRWKSGKVDTSTVWEYDGDGSHPKRKTETSANAINIFEYDASGNVLQEITYDSKGTQIRSLRIERDGKGRIVTETVVEAQGSSRIAFQYSDSGMILEKRIEKDEEIVSISSYTDEDSWTETVYKKGEAVFTAVYIHGARVKRSENIH